MIRALGLIGLLLALAIVGLLVKKQMGSMAAPALPAISDGGATIAAPAPASNPKQVQEQFKQSLDAAMQQQRPMPDDAK